MLRVNHWLQVVTMSKKEESSAGHHRCLRAKDREMSSSRGGSRVCKGEV